MLQNYETYNLQFNNMSGFSCNCFINVSDSKQKTYCTCSVYIRLILAAGLPCWDRAYLCCELVLSEDPVELDRFQIWVLTGQHAPTQLQTEGRNEAKVKQSEMMTAE